MGGISKHKLKQIIYHVIFWILYVASEYIANAPHLRGMEHQLKIKTDILSLPLLLIPTYIIIGYGIPKLLRKNKIFLFSILIVASATFIIYGRVEWLEFVNYLRTGLEHDMPVGKVLKNVVRDYSVISLAICIHIIIDWREQRIVNDKLMKANKSLDIELLKNQLQPHFLFNTLNNIYSLSLKQSKKTPEGILKLSHLLEYLVYQSSESEVVFNEEIQLVTNYIELEKLRYGDHLQLDFKVDKLSDDIRTAPLILLPFVENCFKHGGKNEKGIFWITISIRSFDKGIYFFIKNSKSTKAKIKTQKGIGLQNIKDRLNLLYKDKYTLTIEDNSSFYEVKLHLKL